MHLLKLRLTPRQYIGGLVLGFLLGYFGLNYFLSPPKHSPELFGVFMLSIILYFIFIASCRLRDAGMFPWLSVLAIFLGPIGLAALIYHPSAKD